MAVVVCMDTWTLREILSKYPVKRRKSASLLARLASGVYDVKVPQAVVGEAVTTAMGDYDRGGRDEMIGKMLRAVADIADPAARFPPPDPAAAEMAARIMRNVEGTAKTDALIVAQVLPDPEPQKLAAADSPLARPRWLAEEERRMRRNGERSMRLRLVQGA